MRRGRLSAGCRSGQVRRCSVVELWGWDWRRGWMRWFEVIERLILMAPTRRFSDAFWLDEGVRFEW